MGDDGRTSENEWNSHYGWECILWKMTGRYAGNIAFCGHVKNGDCNYNLIKIGILTCSSCCSTLSVCGFLFAFVHLFAGKRFIISKSAREREIAGFYCLYMRTQFGII
jgi:hypothetical protein